MAVNCTNTTFQQLEPYGDISGVGVVIGFVGTAYFALVLVIGSFFLTYDPNRNPFGDQICTQHPYKKQHKAASWWKANPIDDIVLGCLRRRTGLDRWANKFPGLEDAFEESILGLCDIQLVTGLSIIISGFMLLVAGLSAYHFQMLVLIAWFSSVTHLSGLSILRHRFHHNNRAKGIRVILMLVLLLLLLVALEPTGFFAWAEIPLLDEKTAFMASPAICFFFHDTPVIRFWDSVYSDSYHNGRSILATSAAMQSAGVSGMLLIFGFFSRTSKLIGSVYKVFYYRIRKPVSLFIQSVLDEIFQWCERPAYVESKVPDVTVRADILQVLLVRPLIATFITTRIYADIFGSMLAETYWFAASVLWGTFRLLKARQQSFDVLGTGIAGEEDKWTFGQILPVFLLIAPLFPTVEFFAASGHVKNHNHGSVTSLENSQFSSTKSLVSVTTMQEKISSSLELSRNISLPTSSLEGEEHAAQNYPFGSDRPGFFRKTLQSYGCRSSWTGLWIAHFCIIISGFTSLPFLFAMNLPPYEDNQSSMVEFWITTDGVAWVLLFGLVPSFFLITACGLAIDAQWKGLAVGWKGLIFVLLMLFIHFSVTCGNFYGHLLFGYIHPPGFEVLVNNLVTTILMWALYALVFVPVTLLSRKYEGRK